MKTKIFKSFLFHASLCSIVVFTISSCKERPDQETDSQTETIQTEITTESVPYPDSLLFYNQLMQHPDCLTPLNENNISGNIGCTKFRDGVIKFFHDYKTTPVLDYYPAKLTLATEHVNLINRLGNQTDYGLVIHYGYFEKTPSGSPATGNIIYILGKGKLDANANIIHEPFSDVENGQTIEHYIAIANSINPVRIIDESEFDVLTCAYRNNVKYKNTRIKDLSFDHPLMVYHTPSEFKDFYTGQGSGSSNTTLYIGHGSIQPDGSNTEFHTPLFVLGNDTQFNDLDNLGGTSVSRYERQALDVGRLCPPNCNAASPTCP